jgi:hypothetical protein
MRSTVNLVPMTSPCNQSMVLYTPFGPQREFSDLIIGLIVLNSKRLRSQVQLISTRLPIVYSLESELLIRGIVQVEIRLSLFFSELPLNLPRFEQPIRKGVYPACTFLACCRSLTIDSLTHYKSGPDPPMKTSTPGSKNQLGYLVSPLARTPNQHSKAIPFQTHHLVIVHSRFH